MVSEKTRQPPCFISFHRMICDYLKLTFDTPQALQQKDNESPSFTFFKAIWSHQDGNLVEVDF